MQVVHGLFEEEFRDRNIQAILMPHALPDSRTVSRMEIRQIINDYMTTVMHEEALDQMCIRDRAKTEGDDLALDPAQRIHGIDIVTVCDHGAGLGRNALGKLAERVLDAVSYTHLLS